MLWSPQKILASAPRPGGFSNDGEQRGGTIFFHLNRREKDIAGAGGEQAVHDMIEMLRVHVVDVGFDDQHFFMLQVGRALSRR